MKRFQEFTENVDKVAALKAKQRAAVDKFKSGNEPYYALCYIMKT